MDLQPALRSTFPRVGGQPVQRVHERAEVDFRVVEAAALGEEELDRRLEDEAHRPFDLERGPLFRVRVYRRSDGDFVLLLGIHHIISDFWSISVILLDLARLIEAERDGIGGEIAAPELRYTDFVRWQAEMLSSPEGERHWAYWERALGGRLPVLELPTDRPRPPIPSARGDVRSFHLDHELSTRLKSLAEAHGTTLFVTLLAAFQVLLHRQSGQDDIIVGSPAAGRSASGLSGLVGYFANPLPLRADLSGEPTFSEFLDRVRQVVIDGLEHQHFPFSQMVERLASGRVAGASPIFQVMFILQKDRFLGDGSLAPFALREPGSRLSLAGIPIESRALNWRVTQFDLTMTVVASEGGTLAGTLSYSTDLFDAATIDRMLGHYRTLIEAVVDDPGRPIADLPILTEAERQRVLVEWNETAGEDSTHELAHRLFEAQVARTPEAVALTFEGRSLTYRELETQANRVAHRLRGLGVGPDVLVGLCVERSPEMLVGLLGVLKAGGAYVPLDPDYPPERLEFMLHDARVAVLLTQESLRDAIAPDDVPVLCLDTDPGILEGPEPGTLPDLVTADHLAYVIYTSGSTGRPKGVMITHAALANFLAAMGAPPGWSAATPCWPSPRSPSTSPRWSSSCP